MVMLYPASISFRFSDRRTNGGGDAETTLYVSDKPLSSTQHTHLTLVNLWVDGSGMSKCFSNTWQLQTGGACVAKAPSAKSGPWKSPMVFRRVSIDTDASKYTWARYVHEEPIYAYKFGPPGSRQYTETPTGKFMRIMLIVQTGPKGLEVAVTSQEGYC